jgi:hypothetical protein
MSRGTVREAQEERVNGMGTGPRVFFTRLYYNELLKIYRFVTMVY